MTARDAAALAARDWPVFPCDGKVPLTKNGLHDATTDPERIAAWWRTRPGANVAVVTGAASGLVVLDVDGDEGADALRELELQHGDLPSTVEVLTGGGGRHLYFRHPGTPVPNSAGTLGQGLDVRGDGGYVIAPPSLHPNGRGYTWSVDGHPDEIELADPPAWLLERRNGNCSGRAAPVEDVIPAGKRNHTLASLAGSMRRRGMGTLEIAAALEVANRQRCRPPLADDEVERIAASVGRYPPAAARGNIETPREAPSLESDESALRVELAHILRLDTHGIAIHNVRMIGNGPTAALEVDLSNGLTLLSERFGDLWTHTGLGKFITQWTGVHASGLTKPEAERANALFRQLAEVRAATTTADLGREHGEVFLRAAPVEPFAFNDQRDRYRAFSVLERLDPVNAVERGDAGSIAAASLVLEDRVDRTRFVRAGHLFAHVHRLREVAHPAELARRMELAGWWRPGKRGDTKATSAISPPIRLRLWRVPAGWEDAG